MINLLPDTYKRDIRASRLNIKLLNYNLILIGILISVTLIFVLFYISLKNSQSEAVTSKDGNKQLAGSYASDQALASEFSSNLNYARNILAGEMSYTSLIKVITEALPDGVVLDSINLQSTSLNQQTTFSLHAKNYAKATELSQRFSKSKAFSDVKLQKIEANSDYAPGNSGSGIYSEYQVAVTISAKINKIEQP